VDEQHRAGPFALASSPERARIRAATMELVVEHGYEETTAEMVVARAGVSLAAFKRDFADLRDCCTRVYLANIDEFDRAVFGAGDRQEGWRNRLRAAAYAAARYVRDRPLETRFDMIQMLSAGEIAQAYRDRYVQRTVDLIDEGRMELDDPESLSRAVAVGAFGSIYEFLLKELHDRDEVGSAEDFVPELMYIAVRPYLGHEAARQELTIPPPPEPIPEPVEREA
jgi:AcrR family transcriptional regulator